MRATPYSVTVSRRVFSPVCRVAIFIALIIGMTGQAAAQKPPIEAYGELPEIWGMDFTPDGSRFAFFLRKEGKDMIVVFDNQANGAGPQHFATIDVTRVKPRALEFYNNDYIDITTSRTTIRFGGLEYSQLTRVNLNTGHMYDASPSSMLSARNTSYIVREEYDNNDHHHEIFVANGGEWELIYEEFNKLPRLSIVGFMPGQTGILVWHDADGDNAWGLYELSFEGEISGPIFNEDSKLIGSVYVDRWNEAVGIRYDGMKPSYRIFDPELDALLADVTGKFPDDALVLQDWTDDFSLLLFTVSGGATAPSYYLYDRRSDVFGRIALQYTRIKDDDIAPVEIIEYAARDGLIIPALLTHPEGAKPGDKLPAIIYPHGGPEAYSSLGFDYRAQYFASRGFVVLQPNFRGSSGFGAEFRNAGYGEWGRKMQDDITDGVSYLTEAGWVDPDRICIVGASYGGYAALAGGAFTPDLYQCIGAIAPVADVKEMLDRIYQFEGRNSSSLAYWKDWLGDREDGRRDLARISPIKYAYAFKAPVLLIHGSDDTVVPYEQSLEMRDALLSQEKEVTLIKLEGEDHWMSTSETRLQALRELDRFVRETIGPAQ